MANSYYNQADKVVYDGNLAKAADLNTVNLDVETGFDLVEADIIALEGTAEVWADLAQEWAENPEDTAITGNPGSYSALHWSAKSSGYATAASGSASAASSSASSASTSASNAATAQGAAETAQGLAEDAQSAAETAQGAAETAQGAAETAQGLAETAQGAAETAQTGAETAETNAEKWAEEDEDVEVETGKYSAYHWSQKSEGYYATHSKRNLIINGCCRVNQRDTANDTAISTNNFIIDRFRTYFNTGAFNTRNSATSTKYRFRVGTAVTTAPTLSADAFGLGIRTTLEGQDVFPLLNDERTLTLSFDVSSNVTGIYTVAFATYDASDNDRYIFKEFTIDTASTWERKSITITIPDISYGNTTNERGLAISLGNVAGTNRQTAKDVWSDGSSMLTYQTTDSVNWQATIGNILVFDRIQLEVGDTATEFERRHYGEELALCQRYYWGDSSSFSHYATVRYNSTTSLGRNLNLRFPVTMREAPTLTYSANNWTPAVSVCPDYARFTGNATGATQSASLASGVTAEAEM